MKMVTRSRSFKDPRWPPGRRRTNDNLTRKTTSSRIDFQLLFFSLIIWNVESAEGICPSRCNCNDQKLEVSCLDINLEVVPIQLNPEVRSLVLRSNKIVNIYLTLSFYTNLQHLDISQNKIRNLGSKNFEYQNYLVSLNMSHNYVSKINKDAFKGLINLRTLDMSSNEIEEINEKEFKDLQHIEELILLKNKITNINLTNFNLKRINLSNNQILNVPKFMHNMTKLNYVDLSFNLIETIDEKSLPINIKSLNLQSNLIMGISDNSFHHLYGLQYLNLGDNNLTSVPNEINTLLNLKQLNLSSNFIFNLNYNSFINLFHLNEIYLDFLQMNKLDSKVFLHNINLNLISMSNNDLTYLPNRIFKNNIHLKHLYLDGNRFSTLYEDDLKLDSLKTLKISRNPFTCNCTMLWLYILKHQQEYNTTYNDSLIDNTKYPIIIDFEQVYCHEPKHLQHLQFQQIQKSDLNCDLTYYIILITTVLFIFVSFVLFIVFYTIKYKRNNTKSQCDQYVEAAKHYEDMNRTYYNYSKPNVLDLIQNSDKSNMYVARPVLKDLKTFNTNLNSDSSSYSLNLSKNDLHIYQEPFTGPILNNKRPPNIVYV